jgi:hypothetical protein
VDGALDRDRRGRLAAWDFLAKQTQCTTDRVLPHGVRAAGFTFEATRVPLPNAQGIFKPAILAKVPLGIRTVPVEEGKPRLDAPRAVHRRPRPEFLAERFEHFKRAA